MAAMDDTTINTSSSSTSHQTKMFAVFPILREFLDPNKKGGGSIDKNLYFLAADRPSDIVRKVRQQLAAAGIHGNAMEAMLALDTSPIRAQNLKSARTIAPQNVGVRSEYGT